MNRINKIFKKKTEKVIPFITAGYPTMKDTLDMVFSAEHAGASMVEIGIPFSDPIADGPIIQESSQVSIKNGVTIDWILDLVNKIRLKSQIPIALMGYINPIIYYGVEKFINSCKDVGVDGLIIPDLPLEEAGRYIQLSKTNNIVPILLVSPNTPSQKIEKISKLSDGLIYCVSTLGITGSNNSINNISKYLQRVELYSTCPFIVGFGIKCREDIIEVNKTAHGAVVGSYIINELKKSNNPSLTVKKCIEGLLQ